MSIVLKFSKPTFNVLTTGNVNLAFSSELATHSIYSIVSTSIANPDTSVTINHNLGFVPKAWVFLKDNDGDDFLLRIPSSDGNEFDYYITSNTIVINRWASVGTDDFYVIIFTRSPNP